MRCHTCGTDSYLKLRLGMTVLLSGQLATWVTAAATVPDSLPTSLSKLPYTAAAATLSLLQR